MAGRQLALFIGAAALALGAGCAGGGEDDDGGDRGLETDDATTATDGGEPGQASTPT